MLEAFTIGVSIARDWRDLYDAVWCPETFPRWTSGLARSTLARDGNAWQAEGPEGIVRIRFSPHNAFGIMKHWVDTGARPPMSVPLWVVGNGSGAEVLLTLFRQPGLSQARFRAGQDWVRRDLAALKQLAEG